MSGEKSIHDFETIARLIEEARGRAFQKVNQELVQLYFQVGGIVSGKVARGNWGDGTVDELAAFLKEKQPSLKGFNRRGLYRMRQFYETYTAPEFVSPLVTLFESSESDQALIVSTVLTQLQSTENEKVEKVSALRTQIGNFEDVIEKFLSTVLIHLTWTHHRLILAKAKSVQEKFYYLLTAIDEKYTTRELERALNTAQFERVMISKPIVSALRTQLPQGLFKDPYVFEFLDLPDGHSEKDFETGLELNLQKFILEIGKGFTYMGKQYRLQVGNKDYHTDLLFYHRDLQCMVLFELKIQEFEPEFLGKLNFYLEALDRDVKRPHENPSVGVLLCKGKDHEVVEYSMARSSSPAMIADYETNLIPKEVLANKLHQLAEQFSLKKSKEK